MEQRPLSTQEDFEVVLASERARLWRLCWSFTKDGQAADDLTQETLIEAWKHRDRLRDPDSMSGWLSGIARNVCLRSIRTRQRRREVEAGPVGLDAASAGGIAWQDEPFDLSLELEREELATLLDRALALLPPKTRDVLIERYVAEHSYAEIATLLGMSEGSVAIRLNRGKLALRRVLSAELREDAVAFGILENDHHGWRETRIWCSICGEKRLVGQFDAAKGDLVLRCPDCFPRHGIHTTQVYEERNLLSDVSGFKAAQRRVVASAFDYYRRALSEQGTQCHRCRASAPVVLRLPPEQPCRDLDENGVHVRCPVCGHTTSMSLSGLALVEPEAREFVSKHQRLRTLPERHIDVDGRDAIVVPFEGIRSNARLSVIFDEETFRTLAIEIE